MKQITCRIEAVDGRAWSYLSTSQAPGTSRVHELLRWFLEQVNFGNVDYTCDPDGRLTGLTVGAAASPPVDDAPFDAIAERLNQRMLAVNVAGLFASSREEGIEPQFASLAEQVRSTVQPAGYVNTDFHYAFQLIGALERIASLTFVFGSPPIKTRASDGVVALLREATRAYLIGLNRSSVSVCRTLLESALREVVSEEDVLRERQPGMGELECLISVAARHGRLARELVRKAHSIRKTGNRAVHGDLPNDNEAWTVLVDTRVVVASIFS